ncbi:polysaccharide deacetylase family protein [Saccharothrix longispora]|uniref:Peptidoglycan/xylan/chitin deacetylase (PgdA/CDA1 family) n=1 Tax=Saccharothrix longispora TaxID=33920 RepID=A0ABU1Q7J3_9PSEU|nr:polysaccharide deacetylase family protein [Saccharothrix longispora]MDR6598483.1 peptidoglycan/xylan/chitin deacetylase (PgdA/CDA1 family) [Saccharothrix longispora]
MLLRTLLAAAVLAVVPATAVSTAVVPAAAGAAPACGGYVALTYDDGPSAQFTRPLLNALRSAGARATFFDLGSRVQQQAHLARETTSAGMWIANHSWSHPYLTNLGAAAVAKELGDTQNAIRNATGRTPTLFRPPYGATNATVQNEARKLGLTQVTWSVDSQDWNGASTDSIVRTVTAANAGAIVLMHDGYQSTVNAVPRIVQGLAAKGLCPGRIDDNGRVVAP